MLQCCVYFTFFFGGLCALVGVPKVIISSNQGTAAFILLTELNALCCTCLLRFAYFDAFLMADLLPLTLFDVMTFSLKKISTSRAVNPNNGLRLGWSLTRIFMGEI